MAGEGAVGIEGDFEEGVGIKGGVSLVCHCCFSQVWKLI